MHRFSATVILCASLLCCFAAPVLADATPPMAKQVPKELTIHDQTRVDPWYWLNQREDPQVIEYLEAENDWTEAQMAHTEALQDELFEEIKGRIKQDDSSVPARWKGYEYYARFADGQEYPIYCRRPVQADTGSQTSSHSDAQVLFDVNEYAAGHSYYRMRRPLISPNEQLAAFASDDFGRRLYTIRVRNLETGETYADEITGVSGNMVWAEDNQTLFYTRKHPPTLRTYQIWRHRLGTDTDSDALVYEETDDTFNCWLMKSRSERYIMIQSEHTLRTEYRFLDASTPEGEFTVFLPREGEHEYHVDHNDGRWLIRTNDQAANFRLMSTPDTDIDRQTWTDVIPHRDDVLLTGFEIFADHLIVLEREDGLPRIFIRPNDGSDGHYLDFGEPTYTAYLGTNFEPATDVLRFEYQSLTTPESVFAYDMNTREKTLLKQDEILGGFSTDNYISERRWALARDGRKVPVSLVYHRDTDPRAGNPLLEYAYGSYGSSSNAYFSASRLSLLDRGFIYAIAHVRGGQEMGRWWYEEGKLLNKKNTFNDFIDVGQFLVDEGYTSPDQLYCYGGSAGGLLVGAVVNMAPDLYDGAIAAVPFVDVITTMLDESIPLTTSEFDEWGNPTQREYYDYMLSYSPYDQVSAQDYPNILVTTGLHDSQVQYWEPAKWVARLRATKTGDSQLLLKTDMDSGHGGSSGRYKRYEDVAFKWAFLINLANGGEQTEAMRR